MSRNVIPDKTIAQLIANAGCPQQTVPTMVAIALAESGGDANNVGDVALETSTWGPSVGLWQIRSLRSEYGKGTTRDEKANYDPATNAKHAMEILHSQGLSAWTTYTRGTYRAFIDRGNSAAKGVSPGGSVTTPPNTGGSTTTPVFDITDPSSWLASGLSGFLDRVKGNLKRLGAIVAGALMVLIGVMVMA